MQQGKFSELVLGRRGRAVVGGTGAGGRRRQSEVSVLGGMAFAIFVIRTFSWMFV